MVNFDIVECEIIMPSSEKELEFESKIARVQNLLQITKSEAIGIVMRSLWAAIGMLSLFPPMSPQTAGIAVAAAGLLAETLRSLPMFLTA